MPDRCRPSFPAVWLSVVVAGTAGLAQDLPATARPTESVAPTAPTTPATPVSPEATPVDPAATPEAPHDRVAATEEVLEGVAVHRGRSETLIHAPMELVVQRMMDFPRYTDFMPHVEETRVVHRNHTLTDLYIRVPLTPALGVIWSLLRLETHRTPDRVEMVGTSIDGNMDHFETLTIIERVPGPEPLTRFVFSVLAEPRLPFPAAVFSRQNVDAARTVATGFRGLVERTYALNGIHPSGTPAVPPGAASRR